MTSLLSTAVLAAVPQLSYWASDSALSDAITYPHLSSMWPLNKHTARHLATILYVCWRL